MECTECRGKLELDRVHDELVCSQCGLVHTRELEREQYREQLELMKLERIVLEIRDLFPQYGGVVG
jgi:reverse gyrase